MTVLVRQREALSHRMVSSVEQDEGPRPFDEQHARQALGKLADGDRNVARSLNEREDVGERGLDTPTQL